MEEDVPHVYNNASNVVNVELTEFLYDVAQGIDNYMYTNIAEWTIAQCKFWTYMHDAEWWQKVVCCSDSRSFMLDSRNINLLLL